MMTLKRKTRLLKKILVMFIGVFLVTYVLTTMYVTLISNIENVARTNFNTRYIQNMEKENGLCKSEKSKFVFIKCMKCATETMASILRRFGYVRNLNYALPVKRNLYLGWPFPIEHSDIRESKNPYDILMEHSIYNKTFLKKLMPSDTSFITIIRNPWKQFQSTYNYFALGRISEVPNDNITEYLLQLEHYERLYASPERMQTRYCIPDHFSMTRNIMSHCLGMPLGFPSGRPDISNQTAVVNTYIEDLDKTFDLVMIADYFTESLVLLKRTMCWSFKDIVYHHSNVGNYQKLKPEGVLYDKHRNWSHVDYRLFGHFNKTFWAKVEAEGPGFRDEVEHFRLIQMIVERFCFIESMWKYPNEFLTISPSRFGAGFNITGQDCSLLNTYMLPMLWDRFYEREGLEPENFGEPKDRPKPPRGCSI